VFAIEKREVAAIVASVVTFGVVIHVWFWTSLDWLGEHNRILAWRIHADVVESFLPTLRDPAYALGKLMEVLLSFGLAGAVSARVGRPSRWSVVLFAFCLIAALRFLVLDLYGVMYASSLARRMLFLMWVPLGFPTWLFAHYSIGGLRFRTEAKKASPFC